MCHLILEKLYCHGLRVIPQDVWLYLVGYLEVHLCGVCVCVCVCIYITCMYVHICRNRRIQLVQDVLPSFAIGRNKTL